MKKSLPIFIAAFAITLVAARAQVPNILNYQGRVTVGGTNLTTNAAKFKFALVNSDGTAVYWKNDGTTTTNEPSGAVSVAVAKGLYSTLLGDTTLSNMASLSSSVFTNENVNLRVWFSAGGTNPFVQLAPDQRIGAAGYALRAAAADAVSISNLAGNLNVEGTLNALKVVGGSNSVSTGTLSAVGAVGLTPGRESIRRWAEVLQTPPAVPLRSWRGVRTTWRPTVTLRWEADGKILPLDNFRWSAEVGVTRLVT